MKINKRKFAFQTINNNLKTNILKIDLNKKMLKEFLKFKE